MVKIVTLAFNRPDFIEPQLDSLKKWVKDFEFTVFDNSLDDRVEKECNRLEIRRVKVHSHGSDPSWNCAGALNQMWKTLQFEDGILVYIDSDMFLTNELPDMEEHNFAFVPQVRPGDVLYPWTGLMMFNMDTLPAPWALKWDVAYDLKADVGGLNHFYLKRYSPKVLELQMWTLTREGYSYNGVDCEKKDYHAELEKIELSKPFDVFTCNKKPFIIHYKSASNYPDFYTPEYNRLKTMALVKYLSF